MLAWMLYAIIASLLIAAGAFALERTVIAARRPARFIWIGAMALSVAWPIAMLMLAKPTPASASGASVSTSVARSVQVMSTTVMRASERAIDLPLDTILLIAWAVLSAAFVARIIHAFHSTQRRARTWIPATIDGIDVCTSRDIGPAVVGYAPMQVVVPEWILTLDATLRDLVLTHEREHQNARDPYLLLASVLIVCVMPWNIGLVWQARRLRLAVEVDCDTRVLRERPDAERYALLLLAIAQRQSGAPSLLAATMSEPALNLARRISAMRPTPISRPRVVALCVTALAAIIAACAMDAPSTPSPQAGPEVSIEARALPDSEIRLAFDSTAYSYQLEKSVLEWKKVLMAYDSSTVEMLDTVNAAVERLKKDESFKRAEAQYSELLKEGQIAERDVTAQMQDAKREFAKVLLDSAQLIEGTFRPVYPEMLKSAGIQGELVVSFVVNENGRIELSSFRVLSSTHAAFTAAVRKALAAARYIPATENGRQVRQVVQIPITFSIK